MFTCGAPKHAIHFSDSSSEAQSFRYSLGWEVF
jgi:hypothetical protein